MQDQGGFIFKERFCESDRGRFSKANEQQWGPRLMQSAWSIGVGLSVQFCHPQSQVVQQGPLRLLSSLSTSEAFEVFISFSKPEDSSIKRKFNSILEISHDSQKIT